MLKIHDGSCQNSNKSWEKNRRECSQVTFSSNILLSPFERQVLKPVIGWVNLWLAPDIALRLNTCLKNKIAFVSKRALTFFYMNISELLKEKLDDKCFFFNYGLVRLEKLNLLMNHTLLERNTCLITFISCNKY